MVAKQQGHVSGVKRPAKFLVGWNYLAPTEQYVLKYRFASAAAHVFSLLPIPMTIVLRIFGSDKQMPGWHSYGSTYGELFRKWKFRPVRLLEIGIGGYRDTPGGRSLLAWQAYFPLGRIIAVDIVPKTELAGWRRTIRQADQSSAPDLDAIVQEEGPFDIIIDDGSHLNAHQIFTFHRLWPSLKDDGVYVIEDVQTSFWPGVVDDVAWGGAHVTCPDFHATCYGHFLTLAAYVNHAEFRDCSGLDPAILFVAQSVTRITFEHNLIIIRKGDNRELSAFADRR
jgi:hypothetical protein